MTTVQSEFAERLASLQEQRMVLRQEQASVDVEARAIISDLDGTLDLLDEALRIDPYGHRSSSANRARTERAALLARQAEAERAVLDWTEGDRGILLQQTEALLKETRVLLEQTETDSPMDAKSDPKKFSAVWSFWPPATS